MRDVVFVLVTLAFFALAAAYVRGCARIIGPEEASSTEVTEDEQPEAIDARGPAR